MGKYGAGANSKVEDFMAILSKGLAGEPVRRLQAKLGVEADGDFGSNTEKALKDAPPDFASCRVSASSRSAGEILAHLGDLLDWASSLAKGKQVWREQPLRSWNAGVNRFFAALAKLDAQLASSKPLPAPAPHSTRTT